MKDVAALFVGAETSFYDVLRRINAAARGVALVVDAQHTLIGVITDGDSRRAILAGVPLSTSARELLASKVVPKPITAPVSTPLRELAALMRRTGVSHIPLVDEANHVVNLIGLNDLLLQEEGGALQAVVMAGGYGRRLHPLTAETPKPMLPVGDRPLIQHIVDGLSQAGIRQVHIATHYLAEQISDHFGDGKQLGVDVQCFVEEHQLGTAGAVSLMPESDSAMLVINGDILTTVDFRAMHAFHREHEADLTMAVRRYEVQVPYGVVSTDGPRLLGVVEKPVHAYLVNAGIYVLEPSARCYIPAGQRYDMTDLVDALIRAGRNVICFPVWEYWRDIGHNQDYEQAQADVKNGRLHGAVEAQRG